MRHLNPTLWRTCRVLSGRIRLQLLRELHDSPGRSVSDLAEAVGIGVSDASQELRRLQSRGLLRSSRQKVFLIYRLGADPQVLSAAPLLKAIEKSLATRPKKQDAAMIPIAAALAHPRRIAIVQTLLQTPCTASHLHAATAIPHGPLHHHLLALQTGGWIQSTKGLLSCRPPDHPLARALVRLTEIE